MEMIKNINVNIRVSYLIVNPWLVDKWFFLNTIVTSLLLVIIGCTDLVEPQ